jgi:hypothetical protein
MKAATELDPLAFRAVPVVRASRKWQKLADEPQNDRSDASRPEAPNPRIQLQQRHSNHAPGKIRTCDLSLRRRALYPLSYGRRRRLHDDIPGLGA